VTARRTLTPAARGVSLGVLAALRAGRVDLADQADGSTLATSTAPDGTELLRATLRMPVRGVDTRTPVLPSVSMVPAPAAETPAPVAVVRGAEVPAQPEPEAPPVAEEPAPVPPRDEHNGIAVGDVVSLDDEDIRVTVSDEYGWQGETVATTPRGRPLATVHCDWDDCERVGDRAWRTRPTREKLRTAVDDGPPASKGAKKAAKKVAKASKARPARLTPEPEADALTRHEQRCVVAMLHEGSAWELVWCDEMPGQMTHDVAWRSVEEQAHRARRYDRGGHCAADTRDTPRAEVSRGE